MGSIGINAQVNIDTIIKRINPNFNQNASNLDVAGYNNNCVQCAIAFEANMRGENVEANPFIFADRDTLNKARNVEDAFNNEDVWNVGRNKKQDAIREIDLMMKEDWGKGSRAILQENSAGRKHTMNIINDNGNIIVIDSQNGTKGTLSTMLKGINTKDMKLFRVDNKPINKDFAKWAYHNKK